MTPKPPAVPAPGADAVYVKRGRLTPAETATQKTDTPWYRDTHWYRKAERRIRRGGAA